MTMKKILVMVVATIFATVSANAQNIRHDKGTFTVQPMIGMSVGSMGGKMEYLFDITKQDRVEVKDELRGGFIGGVEVEYYILDWLSASAGVNYAQQGWRMKEKVSGNKWDMDLDYLNIPILANFYVAKGFALKAGVQPGFLLNAKQDGKDVKKGLESSNFSIAYGLSYEFKNGITLDWRAAIGLTTLNKVSDENNKFRSNCATLTVGYKFSL